MFCFFVAQKPGAGPNGVMGGPSGGPGSPGPPPGPLGGPRMMMRPPQPQVNNSPEKKVRACVLKCLRAYTPRGISFWDPCFRLRMIVFFWDVEYQHCS